MELILGFFGLLAMFVVFAARSRRTKRRLAERSKLRQMMILAEMGKAVGGTAPQPMAFAQPTSSPGHPAHPTYSAPIPFHPLALNPPSPSALSSGSLFELEPKAEDAAQEQGESIAFEPPTKAPAAESAAMDSSAAGSPPEEEPRPHNPLAPWKKEDLERLKNAPRP